MRRPRRLGLLLTPILLLALAGACAPKAAAPAPDPAAAQPSSGGPSNQSAAAAVAASAPGPAAPAAGGAGAQAPPSIGGPGGPSADAPLTPPLDLKLAVFGALTDAGFFIAMDKGYFAEQGLNVETIPSESAPRIIPFLANAQVDIAGLSSSPALFNAAGRGVAIKLVANKGRHGPGFEYLGFMVRKDLLDSGRVRDYPDLRGLRIATPGQGTAIWGELARALDKGGLGFADVELETLQQPDALQALANRAIDAALLIEPLGSAAATRGIAARWKSTEEFAPGAEGGLVAYAPHFVQGQPEAARRFLIAYLKGTRAYLDAFTAGTDKEAVIDILLKHSTVKDRALYYTMPPVGFDPNGRINVEYIRAEQELYAREGLLTDSANVDTLVDPQYADYAVARLGAR
jgi:NitT/TauT family transport system substrate-binding protein